MPKVEGVCAQCGKTFRYYASAQSGITCSRSCSLRYSPRKPIRGEERSCEVCGKTFYRNQSELAKSPRFCSIACHNIGQTVAPVIKTCALAGCEQEMRLKPSQAARRYCCRAHETIGRIKRPTDRIHNGRPAKRDKAGYLMVWEPTHPNRTMKGWQYEHRLIAEKALGRHLRSDEQVDHINQIKDDNRPENLQVLSASDHSRKTVKDLWAGISAIRDELAEYKLRFGPLSKEE